MSLDSPKIASEGRLRIVRNVIPVTSARIVSSGLHDAAGMPDSTVPSTSISFRVSSSSETLVMSPARRTKTIFLVSGLTRMVATWDAAGPFGAAIVEN